MIRQHQKWWKYSSAYRTAKDEYSFECNKEIAQEVLELMEKAMVKSGEFHKLHIPLKGEGKIGMNWQEIH